MVRFAITFAIVVFNVSILFLAHCPGDEIAKGRGTASASTQVTVIVPPYLKIDFPEGPLVFRPTPADRARGFVERNEALSLKVLTNMPQGFRVLAQSGTNLLCRVYGQGEFVQLNELPQAIYSTQGFQPQTQLAFDVRLMLPPGAKDDAFVAQLAFTTLPND